MKRGLVCFCVLALVAGLALSCSKPAPPPKPTVAPKVEGPKLSPPPPPAPATKPAAIPAAPTAAPADPAAASGVSNGLAGTTWTLQDLTVSFQDASKVVVKGGPVNAIAPNGLEANYTLKGTALEVSVPSMGMSKSGTFDGTKLIIEGKTAVRQQ